MAVPKKRKKLAETSEKLKKKATPSQQPDKAQKTVKASTRNSSQKIDQAFEIMDHIERDTAAHTPLKEKKSPLERLGFRFHISLDAVMPEEKHKNRRQKENPVHKSSILDIGLTIPFFWKMPIIGGIAQKVVQNIKTLKF